MKTIESLRTISALFLVTLTGVTLTAGCSFETDPVDEEESIDTIAAPLAQGFTTNSACTTAQVSTLSKAVGFLLDELNSTNYNKLKSCLATANLLEYKGSTPAQILTDFSNTSVTKINCVDGSAKCGSSAGGTWNACASEGSTSMDVKSTWIKASPTASELADIAGTIAHEVMHQKGYHHNVNAFGTAFYGLTVPEQLARCVRTATSSTGSVGNHNGTRTPNAWPSGWGQAPQVKRIVGAHANNSCNCVYTLDGYATCGATDYLTKKTQTYVKYSLPSGYTPSKVVGMMQTGSLVCAYYDNNKVSCGSQALDPFTELPTCAPVTDFKATRTPYTYTLGEHPTTKTAYAPADVLGFGGDDSNNNVLVWYKTDSVNGHTSMGTSDKLASKRLPKAFEPAAGYTASRIVEFLSDGSLNCAIYDDSTVSCGTSDDLDRTRTSYATKF